jgi:hypothetical protein
MKAETPENPITLRVAISVARAETEAYMVFRAPARAPIDMMTPSGQPI